MGRFIHVFTVDILYQNCKNVGNTKLPSKSYKNAKATKFLSHSTLRNEALAKFYLSTTLALSSVVTTTRSSTSYAYLITKIGNRNLEDFGCYDTDVAFMNHCSTTYWNLSLKIVHVWLGCSTQYTQFCRIKGCGGAGCPPPPPPIIFERLKLPQQIIYRWKENLSESPNH